MTDETFTYGTTDVKLATVLYKKGWTNIEWSKAGHTSAVTFTVPVSHKRRFSKVISDYFKAKRHV